MGCCHCNDDKSVPTQKSQTCCGGNAIQEDKIVKKRNGVLPLILALFSLILSFLISKLGWTYPASSLLDPAWIAIYICGTPIVKTALRTLILEKKIITPLLISIAIFASIGLQIFTILSEASSGNHESYIFAAGEIAFLMALGEFIEKCTIKKSREGLNALIKLTPKHATRREACGNEKIVPVEQLKPGDIIIVRPNDSVPADGTIVEGSSTINQANMTGESLPVEKSPGDSVLAGTWNLQGTLIIRVTKRIENTALARLIKLVTEAESKKAKISHIADRWASRIVPAAILCSLLVFAFSLIVLEKDFSTALIRGVTILVVFCPCAFALATPTAIAACIGNAAKNGILIKSGSAFEKLAYTDTLVFDKTGTLTCAKLKIDAIFTVFSRSDDEILRLCAAAEKRSQHPIAKAIVNAVGDKPLPQARNISSQSGIGISCDIEDEEIKICSRNAAKKLNIKLSAEAQEFETLHDSQGKTLVYVLADDSLIGILSLADTLRPEIPEMICELQEKNIHSIMMTGDTRASAEHIAKIIGIKKFFAEQLPKDKADNIQALTKEKNSDSAAIVMVGDGVNDAPAFAQADCSIAMGALGAELAIETADIAILNDKVALIPGLINLAQKSLRTIHTNFAISLCVNFAAVILSASGILTPVTGAILHNCSSVLVVLNSAALIWVKIEKKTKCASPKQALN